MWSNIKEINNIECNKFYNIVKRVIFAIASHRNYIFTHDEFNKFLLSISIQPICFEEILEKIKNTLILSVENAVHSDGFKEMLTESGLCSTHIEIFVNLWDEYKEDIISSLSQLSFSEWQLKGVEWELHAEVASKNTARQKVPISLMNLSLYKPSSLPKICLQKEEENIYLSKEVTFQMDYNQLYEFYQNLERIQEEIDNLR